MNKILLTPMFCFLMVSVTLAQGIKFEKDLPFKEALAKAKQEGKLVFMDCYTSWCGPCKAVAKNVFPVKEVGDYYNEHFVNLKMDMEKGEGVALGKRYKVKSYPTFLFIDPEGTEVHRHVAIVTVDELIDHGRIAFDPSRQFANLQKRYDAGDRQLDFMADYIMALQTRYFNQGKSRSSAKLNAALTMKRVGEAYIPTMTKEACLTEDGLTILTIIGVQYNTQAYKQVYNNREAIINMENFDEGHWARTIGESARNYLMGVASTTSSLKKLEKEIENVWKTPELPDFVKRSKEPFICQYHLSRKDYDSWFDAKLDFANAPSRQAAIDAVGPQIIQEVAYDEKEQFIGNTKMYNRCITMTHDLVERKIIKQPDFSLAYLYARTAQKEKAWNHYHIVVEEAKKQGVDEKWFSRLKNIIEELS